MQSYERYNVPQDLNSRHPYTQPPFTNQVNPNQITLAVFDRAIPKLVAAVSNKENTTSIRRDALKTLNELASHQETKVEIINNGIFSILVDILEINDDALKIQACLLIGSLVHIQLGKATCKYCLVSIQNSLVESKNVQLLEAIGWMLVKITADREGCEMIVDTKAQRSMIEVLVAKTSSLSFNKLLTPFFIYLLESFKELSTIDKGIIPFLGNGAITSLKILIDQKSKYDFGNFKDQMHMITLRILGNIGYNSNGRSEVIEEGVLEITWKYLDSPIKEIKRNAAYLLMTTSIVIKGKQHLVDFKQDGKHAIIEKLISKLQDVDEDTKSYSIYTLRNISELPAGFSLMADLMCNNYSLYEEVVEAKGAKPLVELLPYVDQFKGNFKIDNQSALKYCLYLSVIYRLISKYSEALESICSNTVNPAERIAVFLPYCDEALQCMHIICKKSPHNCIQMQKFITAYGNVECTKQGVATTFISLIEKDTELMGYITNATITV